MVGAGAEKAGVKQIINDRELTEVAKTARSLLIVLVDGSTSNEQAGVTCDQITPISTDH